MISNKSVELPRALIQQATDGRPVKGVVIGADQQSVLEGVKSAMELALLDPVLVGQPDVIRDLSQEIGLSLDSVEILEARGDLQLSSVGAKRAGAGDLAMVVKGHVHTDAFMGALLKAEAGIRVSGRRMTHCFHMTVPESEQALIITDAAVNIAPDIKTKQASIINAVELAHAVGNTRPKLAILSATESPLPQMPSSMEAAELTKWAEQNVANADVFGPLAFDNAVSVDAARLKGITSPVAGAADILLVPNIETGNALFKMMVYFMSACAAGVVLGGKIPIVLTSRADPAEARLASIALAKLCANLD